MFCFFFRDGHTRVGYGADMWEAWDSLHLPGKDYASVDFHAEGDVLDDYHWSSISRAWGPSEAYVKANGFHA